MSKLMKHSFRAALLLLLLISHTLLRAEGRATLLERKYAEPGVAQSFHPGGDWMPYPRYSDRAGWDKFLGQTEKKRWIAKGEKLLDYRWQHIPASSFLALHTTGDKQAMRRIEGANRSAFIDLCMAELAEGSGRFLPQIADGLWFYATSWHWSHSNQTVRELPSFEGERIALGNARHAATIPVFWYLLREEVDKISPIISETLLQTTRRIILDPFLDEKQDQQNWWLGFHRDGMNNWTPWCAHGVMTAFLLMEDDPARLQAALRKSVRAVDNYLRDYAPDGACDEGSTYWGQSVPRLMEYLQLLKDASGGKFDVMPNDFIESMGAYVSRTYAGKERATGRDLCANFADANARSGRSVMLVWRTGKVMRSKELTDMALYCCGDIARQSFSAPRVGDDEGYRVLEDLRAHGEIRREVRRLNEEVKARGFEAVHRSLREQVPAVTWYPQTQQCFLRNASGWFLGAKAGNNGEHHNHNDVGSFVLYCDTVPVLVDPGVETYTAATFGPRRYTLWTMQAGWHNTPLPNGVEEMQGKEYVARDVSFVPAKKGYVFSQDLAGAFPEEAACKSWVRTLRLSETPGEPSLEISDRWVLSERKAPDEIHFLVDGAVFLPGQQAAGRTVRKGEVLIVHGDACFALSFDGPFTPELDEMEITDKALRGQWGSVLRRLSLKGKSDAPLKGSCLVKLKKDS